MTHSVSKKHQENTCLCTTLQRAQRTEEESACGNYIVRIHIRRKSSHQITILDILGELR